MRRIHILVPAVLALSGLAGCRSGDEGSLRPISSASGSSHEHPVPASPNVDSDGLLSEVPDGQAAYFNDGKITLGEYEEAFQRFADCATAAGGSINASEVDAVTGQITFESSEPIVAAEFKLFDNEGNELPTPSNPTTLCYQQYYDQVKLWFDLRDPTVVASRGDEQVALFYEMMAPCLEANDVDVPSGLEASSSEFLRLQASFEQLLAEGRCS